MTDTAPRGGGAAALRELEDEIRHTATVALTGAPRIDQRMLQAWADRIAAVRPRTAGELGLTDGAPDDAYRPPRLADAEPLDCPVGHTPHPLGSDPSGCMNCADHRDTEGRRR